MEMTKQKYRGTRGSEKSLEALSRRSLSAEKLHYDNLRCPMKNPASFCSAAYTIESVKKTNKSEKMQNGRGAKGKIESTEVWAASACQGSVSEVFPVHAPPFDVALTLVFAHTSCSKSLCRHSLIPHIQL